MIKVASHHCVKSPETKKLNKRRLILSFSEVSIQGHITVWLFYHEAEHHGEECVVERINIIVSGNEKRKRGGEGVKNENSHHIAVPGS